MKINRIFKSKKIYSDLPILDLDISIRLINSLKRQNIFKLRQLNGKSEEELFEMFLRNRASVKEIFSFSDEVLTEITAEGESIPVKFDSSFEGIDIYFGEDGNPYIINGKNLTISPTIEELYFIFI